MQAAKKAARHLLQLMAANDYSDLDMVREIIAFYLRSKEYQKAKQFIAIGKKNYVENRIKFSILNKLFENVRQFEKEQ